MSRWRKISINSGRQQLNCFCWRINPVAPLSLKPSLYGIPRAIFGPEGGLLSVLCFCEFLYDQVEDCSSCRVLAKPVKSIASGFAVRLPDTILLNAVACLFCFWTVRQISVRRCNDPDHGIHQDRKSQKYENKNAPVSTGALSGKGCIAVHGCFSCSSSQISRSSSSRCTANSVPSMDEPEA